MRNHSTEVLSNELTEKWTIYQRHLDDADKPTFIKTLEGLIGSPRIEEPKPPTPKTLHPTKGPKVYFQGKLIDNEIIDKLCEPSQETYYAFELYLDGSVYTCWSYGDRTEFCVKA